MNDNVIEINDLSLKYEILSKNTINNLNIKIKKNTKTLIVGPSGCGKSTICKIINGLVPNSYQAEIEGEIKINNEQIKNKSISYISSYVSTILQDQDSQFIGLTVGEDVAFIDENNQTPHQDIIKNVHQNLEKLKIEDLINYEPQHISGGQKQKVSLAGLFGTPAEILLFDEPLANLDPISAQEIITIFEELKERYQKTIIVVEHRIEEIVSQNFDHIIVIDEGVIVYHGAIDECLKSDIMYNVGLRKPLYLELLDRLEFNYQNYQKIYTPFIINENINIPHVHRTIRNSSSKEIFQINNLTFNYHYGITVLNDVSLTLNSHEITALLGNNGSGKSTLLNVIMGINKTKKNNVVLNGKSIDGLSIFERGQKIGYVMQNPNHMISQTLVYDEVTIILKNKGLSVEEIEKKANYVLEKCGLLKYKKWPISMLSYGQKRRVTIASVLITNPEVLLLDEPTAGQDYKTFKEIMDLINDLKEDGLAILLITHNMELAMEYAQKAIILDHGEVTVSGSIEEVFSNVNALLSANLKPVSLVEFSEINNLNSKDVIRYFIKGKK